MTSLIGKRVRVNRGFTFIELLIVTTIVMVLASVAIPHFRISYEKFRLQTIYDRLKYLACTAHELSVLEGRIYMIKILDQPLSFALFRESRINKEPYQRFSGGIGKNQVLPKGYDLKTQMEEIFFYSDGTATQTEVVLSNHFDDVMKLQIESSGKILDKL